MPNNQVQSHQALHSYCMYPDVSFDTQAADEQVILVLRAHPVTQISWIFNTFLFSVVLILVQFVLPDILALRQIIFFNFFAVVFILSYIWINFLNWFFNVGIVTDKRIVDIDFYSIIYKELTKAELDKVEDVTARSGGYFESFFNYGDILVQTAGTQENIEFINIPNPSGVIEVINGLLGK